MWVHRAVLKSVSITHSQTQHMLRDHGASASCGVPVYVPAFARTKLLLGNRGT